MKKILCGVLVCFAVIVLSAGFSHAALVLVDDWTLVVGSKYIDNIDYLSFTGWSHVNNTDVDLSGAVIPTPGDTFTDNLVFKISTGQIGNDSTGTIIQYRDSSFIGGGDFELTGVASLTCVHTLLAGQTASYVFDSAILDLYLDTNSGTFAQAGVGGGTISGYDEGTKIATFDLLSGSGNFNFATLNGDINVVFDKSSLLSGYMFDNGGTDLATYGFLAAITDSDSDADLNNDGTPDITLASNWGSYTGQTVGTDLMDLQLKVEGSARLATPEPASMFLFGMGLAGIAALRKKRAA